MINVGVIGNILQIMIISGAILFVYFGLIPTLLVTIDPSLTTIDLSQKNYVSDVMVLNRPLGILAIFLEVSIISIAIVSFHLVDRRKKLGKKAKEIKLFLKTFIEKDQGLMEIPPGCGCIG